MGFGARKNVNCPPEDSIHERRPLGIAQLMQRWRADPKAAKVTKDGVVAFSDH
jgi:hypothetical protein